MDRFRVLVVGIGGIGCEVLKNLVLMGIKNLDIVDMDTVEISNLNRQFLFHQEHISRPKAFVAKESIQQYGCGLDITAHYCSIQKLSLTLFSQFDLVFGALDNLEARRHVNMMCFLTRVPLIDTGSSGYLGQATVIVHGTTECFDCQPKPVPTIHPVCSIRTHPTLMVHCVTWAKEYLLEALFGHGPEIQPEWKVWAKAGDWTTLVNRIFRNAETESTLDQYQISLDSPLTSYFPNQEILSFEQNIQTFIFSASKLAHWSEPLFPQTDRHQFVASAANLRAQLFGIETESTFVIQTLMDNIIAAVCTTNSVVAGLASIQGYRLLNNRFEQCVISYYMSSNAAFPFVSEQLSPPNPSCKTCSQQVNTVQVDFLKDALTSLVSSPDSTTVLLGSRLLHDPEYGRNLMIPLGQLGLVEGDFLQFVPDQGDSWLVILRNALEN